MEAGEEGGRADRTALACTGADGGMCRLIELSSSSRAWSSCAAARACCRVDLAHCRKLLAHHLCARTSQRAQLTAQHARCRLLAVATTTRKAVQHELVKVVVNKIGRVVVDAVTASAGARVVAARALAQQRKALVQATVRLLRCTLIKLFASLLSWSRALDAPDRPLF